MGTNTTQAYEKELDRLSLDLLPQILERSVREMRRRRRARGKAAVLASLDPVPAIDCDVLLQVLNNAQALYTENCPIAGSVNLQ